MTTNHYLKVENTLRSYYESLLFWCMDNNIYNLEEYMKSPTESTHFPQTLAEHVKECELYASDASDDKSSNGKVVSCIDLSGSTDDDEEVTILIKPSSPEY